MKPLALSACTLTTSLGAGCAATLDALQAQRSGLAPVRFLNVPLATWTGEVYRHYKGLLYEVVGTARHSESLEAICWWASIDCGNLPRDWALRSTPRRLVKSNNKPPGPLHRR